METDIRIRRAVSADAEGLIAHVHAVIDEAGRFLPLTHAEFSLSPEQEREFLAKTEASGNGIFLVAEAGGQIVGVLNCIGGPRAANRHVTTLGMSVRRAWCGRGVGRRLMQAAIDWAGSTGVVRRIELFVLVDNLPAIRLYEKSGFQVEGRRRAVFRRGDNWIDDLLMARLIEA